MEEKKPYQSKTIWLGVITAAAAFYPPVAKLIAENPETFASIMGAVFTFLRVISKDKIVVK